MECVWELCTPLHVLLPLCINTYQICDEILVIDLQTTFADGACLPISDQLALQIIIISLHKNLL